MCATILGAGTFDIRCCLGVCSWSLAFCDFRLSGKCCELSMPLRICRSSGRGSAFRKPRPPVLMNVYVLHEVPSLTSKARALLLEGESALTGGMKGAQRASLSFPAVQGAQPQEPSAESSPAGIQT